ncbi:MAG: hypothetical protein A07HR60_00348 [uncultured archaeon A07HR60]|nr:MAG: hypothetical protein A07HR60_00348 [uncultured archaeon A07HR60]
MKTPTESPVYARRPVHSRVGRIFHAERSNRWTPDESGILGDVTRDSETFSVLGAAFLQNPVDNPTCRGEFSLVSLFSAGGPLHDAVDTSLR